MVLIVSHLTRVPYTSSNLAFTDTISPITTSKLMFYFLITANVNRNTPSLQLTRLVEDTYVNLVNGGLTPTQYTIIIQSDTLDPIPSFLCFPLNLTFPLVVTVFYYMIEINSSIHFCLCILLFDCYHSTADIQT